MAYKHTARRFTAENTEGYTQAQIAVLNERYDAALDAWDAGLPADAEFSDDELCATFRHIAEDVQAGYDEERIEWIVRRPENASNF